MSTIDGQTTQSASRPTSEPASPPLDARSKLPNDGALIAEMRKIVAAAELQPMDLGAVYATQAASGTQTLLGETSSLPPPSPPTLALTPELAAGAQAFADNLDVAMDNYFLAESGQTSSAPRLRSVNDLSGEQLTMAFMKVQLQNPDDNVENQNDLHVAYSQLRQRAIKDAQKMMERAEKARKKAEKSAKMFDVVSKILTALSVAMSILTLGASLAAAAAVNAAKQAAAQAAKQAVKEATKEAMKSTAKEAVKTAGKQAAEGAGKEALKKTLEQAGKEAVAKLPEQTVKEGVQMAGDQMVKGLTDAGVEKMSKEQFVDKLVDASTDGFLDNVGNELTGPAKKQFVKSAKEGLEPKVREAAQKYADSLFKDVNGKAVNNLSKVDPARLSAAAQKASPAIQAKMGSHGLRDALASNQGMIKNVGLGTSAVGSAVTAGMNLDQTNKENAVAEADLDVKRSEFRTDQAQDMIDELGEQVSAAYTSKNETIEIVSSMVASQQDTNNKINSAFQVS